jgi:hypothetical protein
MANLDVDPKDPSEIKIYTRDWTNVLNDGATVSISTWVIGPGLTKDADGIVTGSLKTSVKLSGGSPGMRYPCTNTVTTSDGETLELTGTVLVMER